MRGLGLGHELEEDAWCVCVCVFVCVYVCVCVMLLVQGEPE